MGIRETLNQNPGITTGVTAGIIILALVVIVWQMGDDGRPEVPNQAFYTVDDGATVFADDLNRIPPFDKDGKPAVRAVMFRCGSGEPFVAYLERYTEAARDRLQKAEDSGTMDSEVYGEVERTGKEVKKPGTGDKAWVRQSNSEAAQAIIMPECPGGGTTDIQPYYP